jgi:hypothetical protein
MATSISLKQNDLRPIISFTLTENGTAKNLTGATSATLKMRSGATTVSRAGSITDATNGVVQVTFTGTDTAVTGTYEAEIEVIWPTNLPQTFPNTGYFTVNIVDDVG